MNKAAEPLQIILLTAHKGVDLHAATALQVMRDRLEGGSLLCGLFRCQWHSFSADRVAGGVDSLLATGRYYNPNKHHYGVFQLADRTDPWYAGGNDLPDVWPGTPVASDLALDGRLYGNLLGGPPAAGQSVVDVASLVREQQGPVVSGVLWRLALETAPGAAAELAASLAVARRRKEGLLVNPHLEDWLMGTPQDGLRTKETG